MHLQLVAGEPLLQLGQRSRRLGRRAAQRDHRAAQGVGDGLHPLRRGRLAVPGRRLETGRQRRHRTGAQAQAHGLQRVRGARHLLQPPLVRRRRQLGQTQRRILEIQPLDPLDEVGPPLLRHSLQIRARRRIEQVVGLLADFVVRLCADRDCRSGFRLRSRSLRHGLRPAGADHVQHLQQVVGGEGLVHHAVHARLAPGLGGRADHVRGQGVDRGDRPPFSLLLGTDAARGLEAVHDRHGAVHQHQVEALGRDAPHRLQPVHGRVRLDAQARQRFARHLAVDLRIVNHQHPHAGEGHARHGLCRRPRPLGPAPLLQLAQRVLQHFPPQRRGQGALVVPTLGADAHAEAGDSLAHSDQGGRRFADRGFSDAVGLQIASHGASGHDLQPAHAHRPAGGRRHRLGRRRNLLKRHGKGEGRSFANHARQLPAPVHGPDQTIADGQAQARPAIAARR